MTDIDHAMLGFARWPQLAGSGKIYLTDKWFAPFKGSFLGLASDEITLYRMMTTITERNEGDVSYTAKQRFLQRRLWEKGFYCEVAGNDNPNCLMPDYTKVGRFIEEEGQKAWRAHILYEMKQAAKELEDSNPIATDDDRRKLVDRRLVEQGLCSIKEDGSLQYNIEAENKFVRESGLKAWDRYVAYELKAAEKCAEAYKKDTVRSWLNPLKILSFDYEQGRRFTASVVAAATVSLSVKNSDVPKEQYENNTVDPVGELSFSHKSRVVQPSSTYTQDLNLAVKTSGGRGA